MRERQVVSAEELLERYAKRERNFSANPASLRDANLTGENLRGVCLDHANLAEANFSNADLTDARLRGAELAEARFHGAILRRADLSEANLSDANLSKADLTGADLSYANLTRANLSEASLNGVLLGGATLKDVLLSGNDLVNCDLTELCRHRTYHNAESTVDYRSVVLSVGEPRLKEFLRRTGMPDVFVEYMVDCARSLDPQQVFSLLQSTFISYGGPDETFARKLNDALECRGVTTFFFNDDAPPGEKLHRVMRKGVNEHDRVILICSESSLQRPGLVNELEETLARESRDGGRTYLLPVRLDDYVINGWKPVDPDVAETVRDRVIADFRQHDHPAQFEAEVSKLIAVLKRPVAHV